MFARLFKDIQRYLVLFVISLVGYIYFTKAQAFDVSSLIIAGIIALVIQLMLFPTKRH